MAEKRKTKVGFAGDSREIEVEVPDGEPAIWGLGEKLRVVGTRVPRVDGPAKATGRAVYTADARAEGMLHARLLRAPSPGGKLTALDLEKAKAAPGVVLVRALVGDGAPMTHEGLDLAIVVAETEDQAEDALRLCRVEIAPGPVVVDADKARRDDSPPAHPANTKGNVFPGRSSRDEEIARAESAIAGAPVRLERTYRTQVQTHSALEPHGVVCVPGGDGGLTVYASTQGTFSVRDGICGALKLPPAKVVVVCEYMGGGFGAKFGPSAHGSAFGVAAARAAMELKRPVRCMLDRREEHLVGGNRPSSVQTVKIGLEKDGKVLGYLVDAYGTAGTNEGGAGVSNPMIYALGAAAKREVTVITQAGAAAAFRAPGHPQGSFALESMLDEAADAIGMDPLDLRRKIDRDPVRLWQYDEGAKRFGWAGKRARAAGSGPLRRGVGMGSCVWYQGGGGGFQVTVTVHRDGSVEVSNGAQDIGTGMRTVLAVIVAEVLGLDPSAVTVNLGRTTWPPGPGSGGSQTAPTLGPCARDAAEKARAALLGKSDLSSAAWKKACSAMDGESQVFTGTRGPQYDKGVYSGRVAGCQFAEVEVDVETGVVRVVKVLALQDCGRIVDLLTSESQVIGAVIGGIGYALFEDRRLDPATGRLMNGDLESYRLPGPRDVPDVEVLMTDVANAGNSVGMMGLGEPPAVPTAGAIANAVAHALRGTGARVRELPITPARVLAALDEAGRASKGGK